MYKNYKVLISLLAITSSINAHDLWVNTNESKNLKVELGYGHDFPKVEVIAEDRLSIFEPVKLQGKSLNEDLKNSEKNYEFESINSLKDGTYVVSAVYRDTFWTKDVKNKWYMNKKKNEIETKAASCIKAKMEAKTVLNIGQSSDEFSTKAIGHTLEIIPLDNPKDIIVGKPFSIKVLFEGKPLKLSEVKATLDGYLKDKYAFYGHTDLKGVTQILPLKEGHWKISVSKKTDYENKDECDKNINDAFLTLKVRK